MSKIWLGGIYLKEQGGYEIVIRALKHYKKRLRAIESSPELLSAPTFKQIVLQEAMKVYPQINPAIDVIYDFLVGIDISLESSLALYLKSLYSYQSDMLKAAQIKYYSDFFDDISIIHKDGILVDLAIKKINQYQ